MIEMNKSLSPILLIADVCSVFPGLVLLCLPLEIHLMEVVAPCYIPIGSVEPYRIIKGTWVTRRLLRFW